ncbi:MAG: hypothetical protein M3N56_16630 [Actinomycetota bacterium]|nr:hypothetical protein [Actinomycetota bacterium]
MAESVEQRVIDHVVATLEGITITGGYQQSVKDVHVMDSNALDVPRVPAVIVLYQRNEQHAAWPKAPNGLVTCFLHLLVWAAMDKEPSTWRRDIGRLASDIGKALRTDWTRGQLAVDTIVDEVLIANEGDGFPVAVAQANVRVHFRHRYEDHTAAA